MEISSNHFSEPQDEGESSESYQAVTSLSRVRLYLISQTLFLIPALLIPLWFQPPETPINQIIGAVFVLFSGGLLRKMYVRNTLFFRIESFRLVGFFLLSAYLFKSIIAFDANMLLSIGAFISLIWLFILKPEFED